MGIITVNSLRCKKCGECVQSCPAAIIEFSSGNQLPFIESSNESRCIACGHCESVCPESALIHQLTEEVFATEFTSKTAINPSEIGAYFTNRRSIRTYLPKTVDKRVFEQIMDIVRYSPTGTNRQNNKWVIVSDNKIIEQLAEGTINWMRVLLDTNIEMARRLNASALIESFESGVDRICRNAPHIIIGYTDANYPPGLKDSIIASAQLELLLPSFGLGGCWAGYLMLALQYYPDLKKCINLDESSTVHSALMVGYPRYSYLTTPKRNKASVIWL